MYGQLGPGPPTVCGSRPDFANPELAYPKPALASLKPGLGYTKAALGSAKAELGVPCGLNIEA